MDLFSDLPCKEWLSCEQTECTQPLEVADGKIDQSKLLISPPSPFLVALLDPNSLRTSPKPLFSLSFQCNLFHSPGFKHIFKVDKSYFHSFIPDPFLSIGHIHLSAGHLCSFYNHSLSKLNTNPTSLCVLILAFLYQWAASPLTQLLTPAATDPPPPFLISHQILSPP